LPEFLIRKKIKCACLFEKKYRQGSFSNKTICFASAASVSQNKNQIREGRSPL